MTDKSILVQMEAEGRDAPRVVLEGTVRSADATTRYDVVGEIARGGVGVVHRGRDNDLGRDVALKVLHDDHLQSPELVQRFVEEAQIGGQLQHPGIVPVFELGLQSDQRPFFAMKLVKGDTLAARLAARSDPAEGRRELLAVFREVCRTMAYAHARGVIHRDLKPSNVMIGNFGEVQVVDWGFAKVLKKGGVADERLAKRTERTQTIISTVRSGEGSDTSVAGSVMGTPAYMPPEQALGQVDDLDEKGDLFSLGAILAEILTGKPPYHGKQSDRMTAAAQARLADVHARLDACGADPRLVALCRHCLQPLPKDRPASANAIADDVAAYLADAVGRAHRSRIRAVEAEAEAAGQRRKRRQTLVVASSVVVALVIAGATYFWIAADRQVRERERNAAIEIALQDTARLEAAGEWSGALAAAERAVGLGHDRALADEIRTQGEAAATLATRRQEDASFLAELDEIRARLGRSSVALRDPRPLRRLEKSGVSVSVLQPEDEQRAVDAAYTDAFRSRFGSVDASLEPLASSHRRGAFAANLGFWAWLRRSAPALRDTDWRRIDALARAVDPGHEDVRDALVERNADALVVLARDRGDTLPAALAAQVGFALTDAGRARAAVDLLRRLDRRAPGDFWINMRLGHAASELGDDSLAARHYRVAVAVRPDHATAWDLLALALLQSDNPRGAADAYRKAIELAPDAAILWNRLGALYCNQLGDYDAGIEAFQSAIELDPQLVHPHDNIGVALRLKGDLDAAVAQHKQAIEVDPEFANAWGNLALALAGKRAFTEAVAAHEKAIALDPEKAVAHVMLGRTLTLMGQFDAALAAIEQGIELDPESALGYGNLGATLANKGEYEAAVVAGRRAVALDPDLASAHAGIGWVRMKQRDFEASETAFQKAIDVDPTYLPVRMQYGTLLCDHLRRYDEAIVQFNAVLANDPDNRQGHTADAQNNVGVALRGKGALDDAVTAHEKALAIDPEHVSALESLGVTLMWRGDYAAAVAPLERAAGLAPESAHVHANLASALNNNGLLAAALEKVQEAIELDPGLAMAHNIRGNILARMGRPNRALEAYRDAVEADPTNARAHRHLGDALRRKRDPHGAIDAYRKAVEFDPTDAQATLNLAATLGNVGEHEESIVFYRQALALDPENGIVVDGLGISLREVGDLDEALAMHETAVELAPVDPLVHYSLGLTRHWRNEFDAAIRSYERALDLAPNLNRARAGLVAAQQMRELGQRLPAVLAGEDEPATWEEALMLAGLAHAGGDHAGAVRLFRKAFETNPTPVVNGRGERMYASAARAAALSGEPEQAVAWLRTDLAALEHDVGERPNIVARTLARWKADTDLASVRDSDDVSDESEQLWADVDALLERATGNAPK